MSRTQQPLLTTTVRAKGTLTQQRFVGMDGRVGKAGSTVLGVTEVNAVEGDSVPVIVLGIALVEAGSALAQGQPVQSDEQARAVPFLPAARNATSLTAGVVLDEAKAEGDLIRILLRGG